MPPALGMIVLEWWMRATYPAGTSWEQEIYAGRPRAGHKRWAGGSEGPRGWKVISGAARSVEPLACRVRWPACRFHNITTQSGKPPKQLQRLGSSKHATTAFGSSHTLPGRPEGSYSSGNLPLGVGARDRITWCLNDRDNSGIITCELL